MSQHDTVEVIYPILRPRLRDEAAPLAFAWKVFAALSTYLPALHGNSAYQVRVMQQHILIRCPRAEVGTILPAEQGMRAQGIGVLAAQRGRLAVGEHGWWLGDPVVRELTPAPILQAQLVHIVKSTAPPAALPGQRRARGAKYDLLHGEPWEATFAARMQAIGVRPDIPHRVGKMGVLQLGQNDAGRPRIVRGHPVAIGGLTEEESIALQVHGLGGKQRMGCGVFVPAEETVWS